MASENPAPFDKAHVGDYLTGDRRSPCPCDTPRRDRDDADAQRGLAVVCLLCGARWSFDGPTGDDFIPLRGPR
jgi:hypothetical protein